MLPTATARTRGPIELDVVVPPSENMQVAGKQLGLGPARAGQGGAVLPEIDGGDVVEVDRVVSAAGTIALGGQILLAAEILAGRRVRIRIEPITLLFFDLATRELLRTRPNPLTEEQVLRLHGLRPAGLPPRPVVNGALSAPPVVVERSNPDQQANGGCHI